MPETIASLKFEFLRQVSDRWSAARPHNRKQVLSTLSELFDRFRDHRLDDPQFSQKLARGKPHEHHQRLAEMLLAKYLWDNGFTLSSAREGPDFKASKGGITVWIELVTPEPRGISPSWIFSGDSEGVWTYPHAEIALRYTSALKEKFEKLTGIPKGQRGYLSKGIVGSNEPYVIAINQHLLQSNFRTLHGISQTPTACEVLYSVGAIQLHLNRATGQTTHMDHAHRPSLEKAGSGGEKVAVPANSFLDPAYAPVSAVMALDLQEVALISPDPAALKKEHLAAVIHNVGALNAIPAHFLPGQEHWTAKTSAGSIELMKI